MTIQEALLTTQKRLNTPCSSLDAELLLSFLLDCEKSFLISHSQEELTTDQKTAFENLVTQRAQGKPIAYLIKKKEFFERTFFVDERVLIPRPETEEMVEEALEYLKKHPEIKTIIDLGTGSGCIAITLALELPERNVIGLDISEEALKVAQINKEKHSCNNLTLLKSDLLSDAPKALKSLKNPKAPQSPLAIVANLPYIGTETNTFINPEVPQFEPENALYGGPDGLNPYRKAWKQIKDLHLNVAVMFMEIGLGQGESLTREAKTTFPSSNIQIKKDLAGKDRIGILEFY